MRKRMIARKEPDAPVYLTAPQVCQRYGNVSHMWLEDRLKLDATFPKPYRFGGNGRMRFFKVDELVAWERATAAKNRTAAEKTKAA